MTTSRIQLALNVPDVEAATRFYSALFGVEPPSRGRGTPTSSLPTPLKLVLLREPRRGGSARPPRSGGGLEPGRRRAANASPTRASRTPAARDRRLLPCPQDKVSVEALTLPLGAVGILRSPR